MKKPPTSLYLFPLLLLSFATATAQQLDTWRALQEVPRQIPEPLAGHPGNIYLEGEKVAVAVPANLPTGTDRWRVLDDRGKVIESGPWQDGIYGDRLAIDHLPIGWYRVEWGTEEEPARRWTSAAVLARLRAPVPQDSPVCLDSATAWFARNDPGRQRILARLAALAGVNWVRDRLRWRDVQPEPDRFRVEGTTYDTAATIQRQAGLKVLQVFHDTPPWAAQDNNTGRFPPDLRHAFRLGRRLAAAFKGRVQAWEPWNEANIAHFGGHPVDIICSFQKAAYLGFKAGDPEVTVGWNAHAAVPTESFTRGVLSNEAWPYFDTYNIHTYDWPHSYSDLWEPARRAASGKPIWITEADRGLNYIPGDPEFDLSPEDERLKAEFMAQSYCHSLFAGSQRHFHFILGQYHEDWNKVQFGLLREDYTPRPAYVALAATGRFLAGARILGRLRVPEHPEIHLFGFRGAPDGNEADVIVAWAEREGDWSVRGSTSVKWKPEVELTVGGVHDYLGRPAGSFFPSELTSRPTFVVLPVGETDKLRWDPPLGSEPARDGETSPVVLQALFPEGAWAGFEERPWAQGFLHGLAGREARMSLWVYHFGANPVEGTVRVEELPEGWKLTPPEWAVRVDPMGRVELNGLLAREGDAEEDGWVGLQGAFENAGRPVLAFRARWEEEE